MQTGFIIAEYNPFHNGHRYHIEQTRKNGAEAIAVIMSGNYVQRGEMSVCEKHLRARAALENGADLVLELPLKYAVSSANNFAYGGVQTALATGLEGFLSFGMSGNAEELTLLSEKKDELTEDEILSYINENGCTYPVAISALLKDRGASDKLLEMLGDANNILGLEYISALRKSGGTLSVRPVPRAGVSHDSDSANGSFASASLIRAMITDGRDYSDFIPCTLPDNLIDRQKEDLVLTSRLVGMTAEDLAVIENIGGGLEQRLAEAVKVCNSASELADCVKSKRHIHARIRRGIVCAALGITKEDISSGVSYIRVLGANATGRQLLREMKQKASLPVVSNLSDLACAEKQALLDAELDMLGGRLYNLCLSSPQRGNTEYNIPPVFI